MANTGAIKAGKAYVEIGADTNPLKKGIKSAVSMMKSMAANAGKIGGSLVAGGAAILAPLTAAIFRFADAGDNLDKMAARTGASTKALAEWSFAAEQSGASAEVVEKGFTRLQKNLYDAQAGTKKSVDALKQVGLTWDDLKDKSPEEQFQLVAEGIGKIENQAIKAGAANDLFGRSGTRLLPLFDQQKEGMEALRQEARDLGLSIGPEQAKAAADFTDAKNRIMRGVSAMVFNIGGALVPTLVDLSKYVVDFVRVSIEWIRNNKAIIQIVAATGVGLVALGGVFLAIAGAALTGAIGLSIMATAAGALGSVLAFLVSPIGLVIAGVVGIGGALLYYTGAGAEALAWLSDSFGSLADFAVETFGLIKRAMDAGEYKLAAELLWAAIKVAWYEGTQGLSTSLMEWKEFFTATWESVINSAARFFLDKWATLQAAWSKITQFFGDAWDIVVGGIVSTWKAAQNTIADYALEVIATVDPTIDKDAARAELYGMQNREAQDRENARNQRINNREQETQKELAAITANKEGAGAELDAEAQRQAEARAARLKAARKAAADAVVDARAELQALTAQTNALPEAEKTALVKNAQDNAGFGESPTARAALGSKSGDLRSAAGIQAIADLFNQSGQDKTLEELKTQSTLLAAVVDVIEKNQPKLLKG